MGPDGLPVASATVVATGASAEPLTTTSDADGRFVLQVAGRAATIRAFAPGLTAPPVRVPAGQATIELTAAVAAVNESLVVTASQVSAPLSLGGASVSVLTRDDLDLRQTTTLGDALRLVPGFAVTRSGGPGTVTSAFPRGGESDFTLVLVDGVRANAFGGGLDLSQVPIAGAERVEVVRGPQSALYGADAIGGVVQIFTPRDGPAVGHGVLEAGGRAARNGAASLRGGLAHWRGSLSWSHQQEEGFTGRAPANGDTVTNDDSRLSQGGASLGWQANGREVMATFDYVETDRGAPGPFGANPAGNFSGVDTASRGLTRRRGAALHAAQPLGGAASRVRVRAEADVADFDLDFRSAFSSRGETTRKHGRLQLDASATPTLGLSAGGDVVRESGRSTFITAAGAQVPIERGVAAAFVEGRWQPGDRLSMTAGVRAERITRDALAGNPSAFSPRPAFAADTVVSVNPRVTAAWAARPMRGAGGASTTVRASAGTGIRPPDAFEIAFTDNPGLVPERAVGIEGGVVQTVAGGAVQFEAVLFHNTYDDLIVSVGRLSAASRFRTDNIANARARGVEVSGAWRPALQFSARGHYTWLDTEVLAVDGVAAAAPPPFAVGDRLLRRPTHSGGVDLTWNQRRWQGFATATLRGDTRDVEPNFGAFGGLFENPGYAMVSLGGAWSLRPQLSVHARVVNALGARYEDVLGFPALGRTFYAGFRVAARR